MFGFIKFGRKSLLGGEIYREQRRRRIIIFIIFASAAFALLNLILYSLIRI